MKILLISNGMPPQAWGGTESYTAGLAAELQSRGHDVQVMCGGTWNRGPAAFNGVEDSTHNGVPVRRLQLNWKRPPDPCKYLYDNPEVSVYLTEYLRENRPDLVHVTSCERLSAGILREIKAAGLPLVLSLTDFWFLCPRINLLRSDGENCTGDTTPAECLACQMRGSKAYEWSHSLLPNATASQLLQKMVQYPQVTRRRGFRGIAADMTDRKAFLREALTWPDVCITASKFVRDVFANAGATRPIHVMPYGHELEWLDRYTGKTPSDVVRFGFVGQISESKGVHVLLQAARLLHERRPGSFKVIIYGNLDKSASYKARVLELAKGLPEIEFAGVYHRENSGDVYGSFDILTVPSLWYDFPLVIHEAFATKTPVLATDLGGMAEAVADGVNGLRFPRGDSAALAERMERILDEETLLEKLSSATPTVRTVTDEVDELLSLYGGALHASHHAPAPTGQQWAAPTADPGPA
ncbi:MAG: glycosyltransferase family 4 protein [Bryobacterales bacterium]